MKKFVAILAAVVMAAMMVVPAFATEPVAMNPTVITELPGTEDRIEVKVNVTDSLDQPVTTIVYRVDVEWKDLEYTFKFGAENANLVWNPAQHKYWDTTTDEAATGEWNKTAGTVTVKNHSNAAVKADAKFGDSKTATKFDVTATIAEDEQTIITAEGTTFDAAPNAVFNVSIPADAVPTTKDNYTLSTITVSISAAN